MDYEEEGQEGVSSERVAPEGEPPEEAPEGEAPRAYESEVKTEKKYEEAPYSEERWAHEGEEEGEGEEKYEGESKITPSPEEEPFAEEGYEEGEEEGCLAEEVESLDSVEDELSKICDPALKENYLKYIAKIKEIQTQNMIMQKIKNQIREYCCKPKMSKQDEKDVRALRTCCAEEARKLHGLLQEAIEIQSHDPDRNYKGIELETTFDEDKLDRENKSRKRKFHDKSSDDSEVNGPPTIESLQKALKKMQKSIEKVKKHIESWNQKKEEEVPDPTEVGRREKLRSECEKIKGMTSSRGKPPIDIDENMCFGQTDEGEYLQCIIKQQSTLMDDYIKKYMIAQKNITEQDEVIQELNDKSKKLEDQINSQVRKVRSEFMGKLEELADYPTILENEKMKVDQALLEKENIEAKLRGLCKQLQKLRTSRQSSRRESKPLNYEGSNDAHVMEVKKEELMKCKEDSQRLQMTILSNEKQKELKEKELEIVLEELETVRCDTAREISNLKGESECIKKTFQDIVHRTEKELAECKTTSCIAVTERDNTIKELRKQMNTLTFSFDASQREIQCLKQKIFSLAREINRPVKGDD